MSKNAESGRNKSDESGKPFWLTVVFLAAFYAVIGYFALMERPSEPIESYVISGRIREESTASNTLTEGVLSEKPTVSFPIDINTADLEMLTALDGIGPVLAERIIVYRENKPFMSITEIMNVSGIGEGIYERIAPKIFVSGGKTVTTAISVPVITETEITSIEITEASIAPETTLVQETKTQTEAEPITTAAEPEVPPETERIMVNINTASEEELAMLPGIGPKLAKNIVSLRIALGGKFTSLYELLYADGLDEGIFNMIKDYIYI